MMTRTIVLVGTAALAVGVTVGVLVAQTPAPAPAPFSVGNPLGLPDNPGRGWRVQRDVVEREGLRLDLLGGELLVRSGPRRHRGAEPRRRAERADEQRAGSRSSITTGRFTRRDGSASRTRPTSAAL